MDSPPLLYLRIKTLHCSFLLFLEIFVDFRNPFYMKKLWLFQFTKTHRFLFTKNDLLELFSLQPFWCFHEILWRHLFCMKKSYYCRTFLLTDWRHICRKNAKETSSKYLLKRVSMFFSNCLHDGGPFHTETSRTGFYMRRISAMKEFNRSIWGTLLNYLTQLC